jgi:hypothetical protein
MAVSNLKAELYAEIEKVWALITSSDSSWRSDLREIRQIDKLNFIEVDKNGFETHFKITESKPNTLLEFDIENNNLTGHWKGKLYIKDGKTHIDFTEDITPKKIIMKPFVKFYLRKQQAAYLCDLKKALGE